MTALKTIQLRGHQFEVVSQRTRIMDEFTFKPFMVQRTVWDVMVEEFVSDFNALMFTAGLYDDLEDYWDDKHVQHLVKAANSHDLTIGTICRAGPIIRHVAAGKMVSVFPLVICNKMLSDEGAIINDVGVTADRNLVTAQFDMVAQRWADVFCNVMEGKDPNVRMISSSFPDIGFERRPIESVERLKRPSERTAIRIPKAKK